MWQVERAALSRGGPPPALAGTTLLVKDDSMMRITTRSLLPLLAAGTFLGACADQTPTSITTDDAAFSARGGAGNYETTGNHLVLFRQEQIPGDFAARVARAGGKIESTNRVGIAVVSGLSATEAQKLRRADDVESVILEPLFHLPEPQVEGTFAAAAEIASSETPQTAFFFPRQWHLHVIQAPEAWAAGHLGSPDVIVAILDTGLDYNHADLVGRVDLSRSVSFIPSDDALLQANFPGAHPVADLHYHGTHVGATVSSNASAAAGVTSRTTLMGVKVCNVNGSCPGGAVMAGITHATDNGARVINMSLGGRFFIEGNEEWIKFVSRTMWEARRNNVTVVVAAGNNNRDMGAQPEFFNSYCDGMFTICVAATGPTSRTTVNGPWFNIDTKASYSNFGELIDIAAPGGNAGIAVTAACSGFSLQVPVCQTGTFVLGISGTSMAAPHVAGVVAALAADMSFPGVVPMRNHLLANADYIGDPYFFGAGRLNMYKALSNNRFVN
jgi:subtilisin family serine protease